jgi:hypothetical protein
MIITYARKMQNNASASFLRNKAFCIPLLSLIPACNPIIWGLSLGMKNCIPSSRVKILGSSNMV